MVQQNEAKDSGGIGRWGPWVMAFASAFVAAGSIVTTVSSLDRRVGVLESDVAKEKSERAAQWAKVSADLAVLLERTDPTRRGAQ